MRGSIIAGVGFTLVAASAGTGWAQDLAQDLTLSGWVDSRFVGGRVVSPRDLPTGSAGLTDFQADGGLRVGWAIPDRITSTIALRTDGGRPADPSTGLGTGSSLHEDLTVAEMYATVQTSETLRLSAGKSYGPIGALAREPMGLVTITPGLTTAYYGASPTGVWATYAPNERWQGTVLVADGIANTAGTSGKALPARTKIAPGGPYSTNSTKPASPAGMAALASAVDLVWYPTTATALNVEGYLDPRAGDQDSDGRTGAVYQIGLNGQYTVERLIVGLEFIYNVVENGNIIAADLQGVPSTGPQKNQAWNAVVAYGLPHPPFPTTLALQLGQERTGEYMGDGSERTTTKVQGCVLTSPLGDRDLAVNGEVFLVRRRYGSDYATNYSSGGLPSENGIGIALEMLLVVR